jgi:hypothetical protein
MHLLAFIFGGWALIALHRVLRARRRERTRLALIRLLRAVAERNAAKLDTFET